MTRRLSLTLTSMAVLALAFAPAAQAAKPVTQTFSSAGTTLFEDCGTFTLDETFSDETTVTTFFDNTGNPTRFELHEHFRGVITNSASGNTYRDPEDINARMDLAGITTYHGLVYHINGHGVGPLIQDTGTITFDANGNIIFEAGPHGVADGTAPDACSVLV